MRATSIQQFAIVASDSAQSLTEELNKKLVELKGKNPTVTFEGMIARISYEESVEEPEEPFEVVQREGLFKCQDCPFFQATLKADGTEDRRAKFGECQFAHFGRASRDARACERLYQMIDRGEVRLCLAD